MELLLHTFITLFVVLDPVGIVPMFVALVRSGDAAYQKKMAIRSTMIASSLLVVFFFAGNGLLNLLGIGMPAFRIAGGALLFLLSIDMIFARHSGLRSTTIREQQEAEHKNDISVFPLAFPLIAGPGALTTVLLMSSTQATPAIVGGMFVILIIVSGILLLSLLYALKLTKLLGETGANVISRLFGLILAALAAQYIVDGIRAAFIS